MAASLAALLASLRSETKLTLFDDSYSVAALHQLVRMLTTTAFGAGPGVLVVGVSDDSRDLEAEIDLLTLPATIERMPLAVEADEASAGLLVCGLGYHCSFIVGALSPLGSTEGRTTRPAATLWSCDPAAVMRLLDLLERQLAAPEAIAALRRVQGHFPPRQPEAHVVAALCAGALSFVTQQQSTLTAISRALEVRMHWQADQTRMIVHDLRVPLSTLQVSLSTLVHDSSDPMVCQELLSVALESTHALNRLTETILSTARLESGRWKLNLQPIDIAQMVRNVCAGFKARGHQPQPRLRVLIDEQLPTLTGDLSLLERVLANLLANAFKYTPVAGEVVVIARPALDCQSIEIIVRDTGRGIADGDLPRIFDRYFQASGGDVERGVGLGLYFCRLAVEAHGGTIAATSQVGLGSVFTITLPLDPASAAMQ